MSYELKFVDGKVFEHALGKIVCVGRNYAEHAKELNNPVPTEPILFIKPESSAVSFLKPLLIPADDCHYETELSILIGTTLHQATATQAEEAIVGVGVALDLTKRALQSRLKEKSHPWELAKCFDGACPLSDFVSPEDLPALDQLTFSMSLNGDLKQEGDAKEMITGIVPLLVYMSQHFTLKPGDVVLTGTPKGVGQLHPKDQIELSLGGKYSFRATVA